ncbi:hypothetical protein [Burkholderia pseudomallei]|uniref:hypothetical protein n=1 Tax=Burkholderia pseudomallei TaxID=28450 RepID=UPI00215656DE|nr:hypothetical protein [Burkholderia pseudomallei]
MCLPSRPCCSSFCPYVVFSRSRDGELVAPIFFPSDLHFTAEDSASAHAPRGGCGSPGPRIDWGPTPAPRVRQERARRGAAR